MAGPPPQTAQAYWFRALLLILAVGFVLRLWMAHPPNTSDELAYFHLANTNFFNTDGLMQSHGRLAMLMWIRLVSLFWGDHWLGFYLAVYAGGLLSSVAVALFARVILGWRGAVLVSLLWATSFVAIATETRLFVDVLGSAFALLGLTMTLRAAGLGVDLPLAARRERMAILAGIVLWVAILVRETFVTHLLVAALIFWWGREPRRQLGFFAMGVAAGLVLELLITGLASGDAWLRYKFLLGYPKAVSEAPIFQGYSWGGLVTRYPKILWYTGSAELFLMLLAALGAIRWGLTTHLLLSRIGLAALGVTFGLIALALANVSPPVPLLRESLRYYLTSMPFFYLAAVTFLLAIHRVLIQRLGANPALAAISLLFLVLVTLNLHAARNQPGLIRNGNAMPFQLAGQLEQEKATTGPTMLYLDDNFKRALTLFLPPSRGWQYRDLQPPFSEKGLLLVDYSRLHYNIRTYHYRYGNFDPDFYRLIERHPLVWRFQNPKGEVSELYRVGPEKIRRTGGELPQTRWSPPGSNGRHVLEPSQSLTGEGEATIFSTTMLSGTSRGLILQVRFRLKARDKIAGVQGILTDKSAAGAPPRIMGQAWADTHEREVALWVPVSRPLGAFQVTLTPLEGGVELDKPQLFFLQTLEEERLSAPEQPEQGRDRP